jgi:hypothetical protein
VLPAAIDIAGIMLPESYAKTGNSTCTLANNTVERRTSDISEDLCDQLKISRFVLQIDEATDVVKRCTCSITSYRYVFEDDIKDDLFCKRTHGKATSLEVLSWENCAHRVQSMSG